MARHGHHTAGAPDQYYRTYSGSSRTNSAGARSDSSAERESTDLKAYYTEPAGKALVYNARPNRHSRLWNRELSIRLHAAVIEPRTQWRDSLFGRFDRFPNLPLREMEIPQDWRTHLLWV